MLLEHVLLALTEDADASAVMQACNVDPVRLGTDISGYLGRLLEDMRAGRRRTRRGCRAAASVAGCGAGRPTVAAASDRRRHRARGHCRRRKEPAAGLLKAHGLTFEEAIRALQKATTTANAKARSQLYAPSGKPQPVTAAPATASSAGGDAETPAVPAADGEEPDPATPQSVDEILAAARARIQARSIMTRPPNRNPQHHRSRRRRLR